MDEDEKYCEYISINGIRKSCNITSLIDTCNVDDYNFNNLKESVLDRKRDLHINAFFIFF